MFDVYHTSHTIGRRKAARVYLLIPVSLLYLLSVFFLLSRFFTLLVVILHDFPFRHETNMTDHMCNEARYQKPILPRGLGCGNRSVQLERLSPWLRQRWRHQARFKRRKSCESFHDRHVVDSLNNAAQPRLRSLQHPNTVSHTCE